MELITRHYKINKIKNYIRTNQIFFLFNGITLKFYDWILIEQAFKNMNFKYYKIFNKTATKTLNNSVYRQIRTTINGITFFIRLVANVKSLTKKLLFNNFEPLLFSLVVLRINNKVYSSKQLKITCSLNYETNIILKYQYNITCLKFFSNFSK